ncbi:hypothetical protein QW71_12910 [Paenibacillus sp. IHB B 3415]|uniref:helix-turn-helix domain-containing protein n=1 Tax=Paenibacillus sp. IHB B 3415 TaxID=867080 RepID=UPI0005748000|nr:helix-turn-helix transcriptional regulator [Paenibacillus sp. IHB B 3415]KHL95362.1 hypothetical protein QW71_12910 [Paenibacillus sp. IHB B 3415]
MNHNEFGIFLKKQRTFKSYTVRQLAELADISPSYITNLENGKRDLPSPEVLKKLSEPLDVSFQKLMVIAGHVKYEDWFTNKVTGEEYDELFVSDMLGFPSREEYLEELLNTRAELTHLLNHKEPTYNGHMLTQEDRQRVLDMLKALFPEYQQPAKKSGEE